MRLTTADCFEKPNELFFENEKHCGNRVMEVIDSEWIAALREAQAQIDERATFMQKARHFLSFHFKTISLKWFVGILNFTFTNGSYY